MSRLYTIRQSQPLLGNLSKEAIKAWRERVGHEEANKISRQLQQVVAQLFTLCVNYM